MTSDIRAGNCGYREQYREGVDKVDSCDPGAVQSGESILG
jgi:hypothetical protein